MITRAQALATGTSWGVIRSRLARGLWQSPIRGIYATFSGPLPRESVIWTALLFAGEDAVVSHQTAAELAGFGSRPQLMVHVTVPHARHLARHAGIVVHRSRRLDRARHPTRTPPQTRIEETVFDLTDESNSTDDAISWLLAACGERLTTPDRLVKTMAVRPRLRWRNQLTRALGEISDGAQSMLELRYVRDIERAHRLPRAQRQVRHARLGGNIYDDVSYVEFGVIAELDGRVAHRSDAQFRDMSRDNIAALRGDVVLHFGWDDVTARPCSVALQVASVLALRGWAGRPRRCGENCMIGVAYGST